MKPVFCLTIFIGSLLLFAIQPMVGKILLPSLGGTPAVWNTCVVFFQALLLLGYGYAHFVSSRLSAHWQVKVHLVLLTLVAISLPIQARLGWEVPQDSDPTIWLLLQLLTMVGLPFFVISSNAPLLQRWYSMAGGQDSHDPYFLYAFSNAGSLIALIGYPFVLERLFGLSVQTGFWMTGFAILMAGFVACGWFIFTRTPRDETTNIDLCLVRRKTAANHKYKQLDWKTRLYFIALAAVPSSLMLGVTTCVTTDAGSVPLLWVIPLALYLVTFIFAFAKKPWLPHVWMVRLMPYLVLLMAVLLLVDLGNMAWKIVPVHLLTFFVVTMVCHGELARSRPAVELLTEFYLLMSVGGVVGGFFNAIVAPQLFNGILEYPLVLILACLLRPELIETEQAGKFRWLASGATAWLKEFSIPLGVGAYIMVVGATLRFLQIDNRSIEAVSLFALPAVICFAIMNQRIRFASTFAAIVFGCNLFMFDRNVIEAERGFFGVTKVAVDEQLGYRFMINGRTVHGIQRLAGKQTEPLSYYHPSGPIGDVFRLVAQDSTANVGVIGLGTGSIASYAKAGQRFDFFEIDPIVTEFASNPKFFTFLSQSAGICKVIQGDARIQLQKLSEQESRAGRYDVRQVAHTSDANYGDKDLRYDLLILDAFSSDSIPSHLITREALQLYRERTRKDGVIAMHISNNFIDLEPLVALLAADASMPALIRTDPCSEAITHENAKTSSIYVVMSDNQLLMQQFANLPNWRELNKREGVKLWTDDYSCMLEIIRWSR